MYIPTLSLVKFTMNFILDCEDITQDDEWTIERIMKEYTPFGWTELFRIPGTLAAGKTIQSVIDRQPCGYVPLKKDLFKAYHLTPLSQVRVVIICQDPYPGVYPDGTPHATGLCLSISKGRPIQPSLKNVFIELKRSDPQFVIPDHGDLSGWAMQGCLLLNACLTTAPGVIGGHGKIWNGFIKNTIDQIRLKRPNTIVVLLGKKAQDLEKMCGSLKVLKYSHPSDRSFDRGENCLYGSGLFNIINELLVKREEQPIMWSYLP